MAKRDHRPVDPAEWLEAARAGRAGLTELRAAAVECRACELWKCGTQTVFGEGAADARVLLVGEQPGDREDRVGRPFVGPAGQLLDRALAEAGIDRERVYVTNVVKHFRWDARGKWRIHKKPRPDQVRACRPWLEAEIAAIDPQVVVCLGATAAQALLGRDFRVTQQRGQALVSPLARCVVATVHPASLLRAPDEATRRTETERFIADLRTVAALTRRPATGRRRSSAAPRVANAAKPPRRRRGVNPALDISAGSVAADRARADGPQHRQARQHPRGG